MRAGGWRKPIPWILLSMTLLLSACATNWAPQHQNDATQFNSHQTSASGNITVSVAALTDAEARRHFGVDIGSQQLQALWVSVRNGSGHTYWFIRNIVDRDLYSPDEVAQLVKGTIPENNFESMRQYFRDEAVRIQMVPGYITEGFIYVPRVEGGRYVEIRLTTDAYDSELDAIEQPALAGSSPDSGYRELRFGFGLTLPDGEFDYESLDTSLTYGGRDLPDLDVESLREELKTLPCCVTNTAGDRDGDPLNIVMIGESADVMSTLSRAGWSFTHRISAATVKRVVEAALAGEGYAVAPVSSLYTFGRAQDIALQRARRNIARRNHMRLWLAPYTFNGRPVWVGQVSRDIGIKATTKSPSLTTHIIDPNVDLAREYLLHGLLAEGFVQRFGFVSGSRVAERESPAFNLTDDPYFSDGMRLVVVLSSDPIPYENVRNLRWKTSTAPVAEEQTEAASHKQRPMNDLPEGG